MADVYPVQRGPNIVFIPGIPAVPRLGITKKEADALVATGAFTTDPPPKEAAPKPTAPADAGALDSPEE
jgi:hypothetical protein